MGLCQSEGSNTLFIHESDRVVVKVCTCVGFLCLDPQLELDEWDLCHSSTWDPPKTHVFDLGEGASPSSSLAPSGLTQPQPDRQAEAWFLESVLPRNSLGKGV